MAKIETKTKSTKGIPPELPSETLQQKTDKLVSLNFKIPAGFRKELKTYALANDMTMTELVVKAFERYKDLAK